MPRLSIERATELLSGRENIAAAWVFGSGKDGQIRPGGDFDIGVLFVNKPSLDELADLRADLQQALHFEEIDLSVLNDASAVLRFEAARGRLLCCRDRGEVAGFVSLAAREYEDEMALAERWRRSPEGSRSGLMK